MGLWKVLTSRAMVRPRMMGVEKRTPLDVMFFLGKEFAAGSQDGIRFERGERIWLIYDMIPAF